MGRAPAKQKHRTPTSSGTLAHIRIHRVLHRKHFRKGTDPTRIAEWLLKTEMRYRGSRAVRTGKFADDAQVYLETVKAMPTYHTRKKHIEEWRAVFDDRMRDTITADEIRAQLQRWRSEPREVVVTGTRTRTVVLSASAVNHRRTALMHLYTVLDGKSAPNPVRDVPKFAEPAPAPRALPYSAIRKLFASMPASRSKARLMVLAYTGIPHAQIRTLKPEDLDSKACTVAVHGRRKGGGTRGRVVPLTKDGLSAMKLMAHEDAWGSFSPSTLRRIFQEACEAVGLGTDWTPYDLRHSFGTEVYRRSGDIRATQLLLDHSDQRQTHRYTVAAADPRVAAAVAAWEKGSRKRAKGSKKSSKGANKRGKTRKRR